jgi:hypothetical protein
MNDISQLRKKLFQLNQKRWKIMGRIMRSGELLTASVYERFIKCGNKKCKCAEGELHGPFLWINQNRKGEKLISTSCAEEKADIAKEYSKNYKEFKENWDEIRTIDKEIDSIIGQLGVTLKADPEQFVAKRGETRGRKSSQSPSSIKE